MTLNHGWGRQIQDGDRVRIHNEYGENIEIEVAFDDQQVEPWRCSDDARMGIAARQSEFASISITKPNTMA